MPVLGTLPTLGLALPKPMGRWPKPAALVSSRMAASLAAFSALVSGFTFDFMTCECNDSADSIAQFLAQFIKTDHLVQIALERLSGGFFGR